VAVGKDITLDCCHRIHKPFVIDVSDDRGMDALDVRLTDIVVGYPYVVTVTLLKLSTDESYDLFQRPDRPSTACVAARQRRDIVDVDRDCLHAHCTS